MLGFSQKKLVQACDFTEPILGI